MRTASHQTAQSISSKPWEEHILAVVAILLFMDCAQFVVSVDHVDPIGVSEFVWALLTPLLKPLLPGLKTLVTDASYSAQ